MIATMPRLARLSLKRCRGITDAGLCELAPMTALSNLSLARCYQVQQTSVCGRLQNDGIGVHEQRFLSHQTSTPLLLITPSTPCACDQLCQCFHR